MPHCGGVTGWLWMNSGEVALAVYLRNIGRCEQILTQGQCSFLRKWSYIVRCVGYKLGQKGIVGRTQDRIHYNQVGVYSLAVHTSSRNITLVVSCSSFSVTIYCILQFDYCIILQYCYAIICYLLLHVLLLLFLYGLFSS